MLKTAVYLTKQKLRIAKFNVTGDGFKKVQDISIALLNGALDEAKIKDIDKSSPKLASTAKAKETEAKPAEKKKVPKKELSEADKFLTEVIILLAKEKKKEDKSD